MANWVEISFDCLPLRCVGQLDVPADASPVFQARYRKIQHAVEKHGTHNSYYLYKARCIYRLTNDPEIGMLDFRFEGTVLTDSTDLRADSCDLEVELDRETCEWLTEPAVKWFRATVPRSVAAEFDRYIEAGDLERARKRIEEIQAASDDSGGFLGMYL